MAKRKTTAKKRPTASLGVSKTYKMYIGGKFPRTESGRYYSPMHGDTSLGNICQGSRKDVRNAIVAARAAQPAWAGRTAYNKGQILYRIAEMLEGRREQFKSELMEQGHTSAAAETEVQLSIDRHIVYAGWCDKYQQLFSSVNPVASNHFNFSVLEPMGVVFVVANEDLPILGLVSLVAPVIAGGNTCVVLASESKPLSAVTFAEVLNTSDVPGGVVNILTGNLAELSDHFSLHLDVNAIAFDRNDEQTLTSIKSKSANNVKRVKAFKQPWLDVDAASPFLIQYFSEVKTTWHPIEKISASGSGY